MPGKECELWGRPRRAVGGRSRLLRTAAAFAQKLNPFLLRRHYIMRLGRMTILEHLLVPTNPLW